MMPNRKGKGSRSAKVLTFPGWRDMQVIAVSEVMSCFWRVLVQRTLASLETPGVEG